MLRMPLRNCEAVQKFGLGGRSHVYPVATVGAKFQFLHVVIFQCAYDKYCVLVSTSGTINAFYYS